MANGYQQKKSGTFAVSLTYWAEKTSHLVNQTDNLTTYQMYKNFTSHFCAPPGCANRYRYKVFFLLALLISLQAQANVLAQQLTYKKSNAKLEEVFLEISKQTGYNVVWSNKQIGSITVNADFQKSSLVKVLDYCLYRLPYNYVINANAEKTIVITDKRATSVERSKAEQKISGEVVDDKGLPLPGASIIIKGSTQGTVSKPDGSFSINANPGDVLVVSFIGYLPTEVKVSNQLVLKIVLKENPNTLSQVVVTSLGIKRSTKSLTYNVQQISGEEITKVKDANFVNSLAGKVAGVTINSSSAGVGGSARVVLRGTKSINGNNNALYVVDGIPLPSLSNTQPNDLFTGFAQSGDGISNINPEDIESISVLSGPSAAALYGSDAANGVILITTKRGAKNSLSIKLSNSTDFTSPFVMPRFQNEYGSDAGSYYSWGSKLITPSTYQPKDFFQTGVNVTNSLSLSTGNDKNQTYFSVSTVNANGIIPNNNFDRYNFNIRNTSKFLNDKLEMDLGANYIVTKEQNMLAQGQYFNPLIPIYLFPRGDNIVKYQTYERYDATRNFKVQYWPFGDLGYQMQNPYWIINRDLFNNHKNRYQFNGSLKYNINNWLNVVARVRNDRNTSDNNRQYSASTSGLFAGPAGAYFENNFTTSQTYADVLLNVDRSFKEFNLTANIGASLQDVVYKNSNIGGNLQSVPNLFIYDNLNLTQTKTSQNGYHDQTQAVFANTQLSYKSMVFLNATLRNDWVSALGNTSAKSILYPSVGLSTVITDLLKLNSSFLSFAKARVSYSEVGNAPQRFISSTAYPVVNGFPQLNSYFPVDLRPERTKSLEAGVNMMFLNGKIKLDVTAYKSSTFNQLFNPQISVSSGFSNIFINAGQVDNKGIEASLGYNQNFGDIKWAANAVFSLNRNKIVKLLPNYTNPLNGENISIDSLNMGGTDSYRSILRTGGSMGDIYVNTLKTDEHGFIAVDLATQGVTATPNRFIKAGNSNPDYNIGFRNSVTYKGVNVGFLVTARVGGFGISATQAILDNFGVSANSADARNNGGALVNGYRVPAQAYYQTIGGGTSGIGALYVYSATNVRLGEASIGWEVPVKNYIKYVKGLNISVTGRNLFMFYNKAPFDPESTASTGTYFQGIDYFNQPSLRSIGFAARVSL